MGPPVDARPGRRLLKSLMWDGHRVHGVPLLGDLVYPGRVNRWVGIAGLLLGLVACDRPPSEGVQEWTPQDHDHLDDQGGKAPTNAEDKAAMLIEAAWSQNCAVCHGPEGHGDGPNGALVKAPDLTRGEWQASVSDQDIATRIREGKGLMPKAELPEEVVVGLVARIRALRGP